MLRDLFENLVFEPLHAGIKNSSVHGLNSSLFKAIEQRTFSQSEIADLNIFAHLLQIFGQLLNQPNLDAEIDRQIWVLMCGINGFSDKEVDVGGLFKQNLGNLCCTILSVGPRRGDVIARKIGLGVFDHPADGDYSFGDQINPLNIGDWRNIRVDIIDAGIDRFA